MSDILPTSRLSRISRQASCHLNGEAVVLHLKSGTYYGLNEVGARIWEWLESSVTPNELAERLVSEYDVDAAACLADVLRLLGELREVGLVEVGDGAAEAVPRQAHGGA